MAWATAAAKALVDVDWEAGEAAEKALAKVVEEMLEGMEEVTLGAWVVAGSMAPGGMDWAAAMTVEGKVVVETEVAASAEREAPTEEVHEA